MSRSVRVRRTRRLYNILNVGLWFVLLGAARPVGAPAQTPTPDPAAWRPMAYADLQRPNPAIGTYADIWKDAIGRNNRAYKDRGDHRFADGNAPATEAHFVIWSTRKSVVLSTLDTATGCTLKVVHAAAHATIRTCPVRLAIYEGALVRTMDGGPGCYLERVTSPPSEAADLDRAAAYASYDPATRTLHTGLVIDHQAVEGCSQTIPLPP